jgi:hypothetical protein
LALTGILPAIFSGSAFEKKPTAGDVVHQKPNI